MPKTQMKEDTPQIYPVLLLIMFLMNSASLFPHFQTFKDNFRNFC